MKIKAVRNIATIILCLLLVVSILSACTDNNGGPDDTGNAATSAESTQAPETEKTVDENGFLLDSLPEDLNYNNEKVTLLHWNDAPFCDFESEMSAEPVNNAVYTRNVNVEERLKVDIEFVGIPGNSSNKESYVNTAKGSILSGTGDFDIMSAHSLVGQGMMLENLLGNLNTSEYLDFEKPWWPQKLIEAASINDKLYFASGDISTNMLWYMTVLFYNVDSATKLGIEDLHDVVLSGSWTLEKLEEVIKNTYVDNNSNGIKDSGDNVGLYCPKTPLDSFLYGSGVTVITHDSNGAPIVSDEFGSEKTISLVERLCTMFFDTNDAMTSKDNNSANFAAGEYVLYFNYAHNAASTFKDVPFKYSVLPCPKYDDSQEQYITTESFSYSIYMIPSDAKSFDKSGAVIEALASAGYRTTTPAVFELSLKSKYALNDKTVKVYDIIKSNVCFDLGRMFGANLDNKTHVAFRNAIADNNRAWATVYAGIESVLASRLKALFKE